MWLSELLRNSELCLFVALLDYLGNTRLDPWYTVVRGSRSVKMHNTFNPVSSQLFPAVAWKEPSSVDPLTAFI